MTRVLIIEDEKLAARRLEELILSVEPATEILATLDTVRESIEWLSSHDAELIFMDIHLSDGISFDIFKNPEIKTPVIFTTAYDEYALKAFKVNSIDYLLKPFSRDDVKNALDKFQSLFRGKSENPDLENLARMLSPHRKYQNRFLVSAGSMIKSLTIDEIAYFYNLEKNTFICTDNNHSYAYGQSLDKLEMLTDPEQFFRVNRNFLVGFKSIKRIFSLSKSRIKLELQPQPEQEVLVSFNKSGEFRQWLGKLPES
jgi:two-component system, LytTR family, response regulator LytT